MTLPSFLEYLVSLCFKRQYPKQNTVARLKSNILTYPKFWAGHTTAHVCVYNYCFIWARLGFLWTKDEKAADSEPSLESFQ